MIGSGNRAPGFAVRTTAAVLMATTAGIVGCGGEAQRGPAPDELDAFGCNSAGQLYVSGNGNQNSVDLDALQKAKPEDPSLRGVLNVQQRLGGSSLFGGVALDLKIPNDLNQLSFPPESVQDYAEAVSDSEAARLGPPLTRLIFTEADDIKDIADTDQSLSLSDLATNLQARGAAAEKMGVVVVNTSFPSPEVNQGNGTIKADITYAQSLNAVNEAVCRALPGVATGLQVDLESFGADSPELPNIKWKRVGAIVATRTLGPLGDSGDNAVQDFANDFEAFENAIAKLPDGQNQGMIWDLKLEPMTNEQRIQVLEELTDAAKRLSEKGLAPNEIVLGLPASAVGVKKTGTSAINKATTKAFWDRAVELASTDLSDTRTALVLSATAPTS